MSNAIAIATATNAGISSIKLSALNVPASVVVSNTTPAAMPSVVDYLKSLESARISWETTELAASNKRLYSILQKAYQFYLVMKNDANKDVRAEKLAAMEAFITERGYVFTPSSHDMTRVVKCVFGVDRRRVSAYSIALREALRQDVAASDLIAFLEENGGVEQIRMGGTKPLSVGKRAELGKAEVGDAVIAKFQLDPATLGADADWTDKQVVFVATCLPDGVFELSAVVRHDGAVNSALAAHYSLKQAKLRQADSAAKKAVADAEAAVKRDERAKKKAADDFLKTHKAPKKKMTKKQKQDFALLEMERIAERKEFIERMFDPA